MLLNHTFAVERAPPALAVQAKSTIVLHTRNVTACMHISNSRRNAHVRR